LSTNGNIEGNKEERLEALRDKLSGKSRAKESLDVVKVTIKSKF
jgi:hypothetical protein